MFELVISKTRSHVAKESQVIPIISDLIFDMHDICMSAVYLYFVTIKTLNYSSLAFQLKVKCICKKSFNNQVHHGVSHRATKDINSDKTKGKDATRYEAGH